MKSAQVDEKRTVEASSGVITIVACRLREGEGSNGALHAKFLRSALGSIQKHGYVFFHTPKSFDLAFTDPLLGLNWCLELQRYILSGQGPDGLGLSFGLTMGVTSRRVDPRTKRQLFEGPTVEWARRFAISANPNQILSGDVLWASLRRHAYMGKLSAAARNLGVHRFAGVEGAREVMELRPTNFETLTFAPIHTLGTNVTNLPSEPGYFVGREPELATIRRYFEEGQNLVSLVGAPGMGASRLAVRYGALQLANYPGGVWACSLHDVSTAGGMLGRVAQALRLPIQISGIGASSKVVSALAARPSMLIILDGVDSLIDVCGLTLQVWLERAPNVQFLATSHTRIGLSTECVMQLESMAPSDGVELFVRHARDSGARLSNTEEEVALIETIVDRVDGMPLGILLAAGWTDMLSVAQLEERLRTGLSLLSRPRPGNRRGQRTLNSSMNVVWENLSLEQRALLGQCSIFKSPFSIDDVEAVVEMHRFPNPEAIVELLMGICDRSLARSFYRDSGEVVFELYAAAREFGRQHLASSGEQRSIQGRLTEHVLGKVQALNERVEQAAFGATYDELDEYMDALEDIRLTDGRPGDAGRAILCMEPYLLAKGKHSSLESLIQRQMNNQTQQVPIKVQIDLMRARVDILMTRGDVQKGIALAEEALSQMTGLARELEWALRLRLAIGSFLLGEESCISALEEVVDGSLQAEDRHIYGEALLWLSRAQIAKGEFASAFERARLARSTSLDSGAVLSAGLASLVLASLERRLGQTTKGLEDFAQAEQSFMLVGNEGLMALASLEQARFELSFNNPTSGQKLANEARVLFQERGSRRHLAECYQCIAYGHHLANELNSALDGYQESARLFKEAGDEHSLAEAYLDIGRLLQEAGDTTNAVSYCEKALELFKSGLGGRSEAVTRAVYASLIAEGGRIPEANKTFQIAKQSLAVDSDPQGETLCRIIEAQIQLASAWRVGARAGPELRSKALKTFNSLRSAGGGPSSNAPPVEVLISLRVLRRRVKQAGK